MTESRSAAFPAPDPLPDPTPLPSARSLPAFPVDALPEWTRAWAEAEAEATQTPVDLAACCVLGVLAAAAGGRAVVQPRGGWREPVNLYLGVVMAPGSRKSAVIAAATAPLYVAEEDLVAKVSAGMAEAFITKDIAQKAAQKAAQQAANASDAATRAERTADAVSAQAATDAIEVPATPRLLADDITPEALGSLLALHGGRLAIISAEGGVFDIMGGRYSGGVPSLDVFLKGHAGDPLRVDRKGRAAAEFVRSPALTMLLTIQPAVLAGVARNAAFRGRGLTQRYLFSLPQDIVGKRKINPATMTQAVADTYERRVRRLVLDRADWTDPAVLPLTPAAHALLLGLESVVEPRLARDGEYGPIREWASKFCGAVVRIAGLLHLAEGGQAFRRPITDETLGRAIVIGDYFAHHAAAAFDLLGDGGTSNASYLLAHLRRKAEKTFTIRQLHVALPRGRFATAEDVAATVDTLVDHGWALPVPAPPRSGPGRTPSPAFEVHPVLLGDEDPLTAENLSTVSTQSTETPSLLDLTRPVAAVFQSTVSTQSTEPPSADPGSVDYVENVDTSTTSGGAVDGQSVDSVESVETSTASGGGADDRTCRRCRRESMHALDADALCVERCAKPPAPQQRTQRQPDRTCTRCKRAPAIPGDPLGRCRRCAYPAEGFEAS